MKQQNGLQRYFALFLLAITLIALLVIPFKKLIAPRVAHTFYFDNRQKKMPIERLAVVGDFSDWQERYYLYDSNHDGIWQVTVPLKIGWHSYRFLLNGKNWLRDWSQPDYGGPYSNTMIYVDTITVPGFRNAVPATGSWLYQSPRHLRFVFDRQIGKWLQRHRATIELDSIKRKFTLRDSVLVLSLPVLAEGEHDWQIILRKNSGEVVLKRSGLFFLNANNQPPKARAGHTQIVYSGQTVTLNGALSFDPDFEPITQFRWRQTAGPQPIALKNADRPMVSFQLHKAGTYRFRLMVKDSLGLSDFDETDIVVLAQKEPQQSFSIDENAFMIPVKKIALVGEFNRWDASKNPMHFDTLAGQWRVSLPLGPGQWEYKYVVNDSLWLPDPTNPDKVPDGWNGFNSLRIIEHDSTFDGHFVEVRNANRFLTVAFQARHPENLRFRWFGDAQNPEVKFKRNANRLQFDKNAAQGIYFYYLVLNKGQRFSRPRILIIRHFQTTAWHNFRRTPAWADTAVIYELFLRRFTREATFRSLAERLPDLKRLGVNTLWMLPVYQSPTEHGYAPTSLFGTQNDYGNLADYRYLIRKAHKLRMKVLFDFVANHLSDQHRFVRAAYQNPESPLRRWFYWKPDGTWGYHNDWDTLVNLNYHTPWVRHYMIQAAQFWLNVGVDGFRCDVAWAVPHSFWKDFRRSVKPIDFNTLLLDEVLPRQPAFHDDEFDMSYDTDFYGNILDVLRGRKPISAIPLGIEKSRLNYPQGTQSLRYLENHDLPRFIEQFGPQLTRVMAVILFTVPGTPLIYYGQEYGARERRPDFYTLKNSKWFDFYQKLIKFRKNNKALTFGRLYNVKTDNANRIWWYRRQWQSQRIDVIINLANETKVINNFPEGTIKRIEGSKFKQTGKRTIKLEGKSFIIIQKDEGK